MQSAEKQRLASPLFPFAPFEAYHESRFECSRLFPLACLCQGDVTIVFTSKSLLLTTP